MDGHLDGGTEFAAYGLLAELGGKDVYFCDVHSLWQKGAVENVNGWIRRFLPGERNLADLKKKSSAAYRQHEN